MSNNPYTVQAQIVLEAPAKVIRPKRVTRQAPRLTDGVTYPVTVTRKA